MDDFMSKVTTSATMLLTGFTVVFAVLILLILIIYIYGTVITKAQYKSKEKKLKAKQAGAQNTAEQDIHSVPAGNVLSSDEIPREIVAVIAAAVDSMYGSDTKVRIKNIKKSGTRSAWANAGILDNTRPF